jgi:uncharacterized protein YoxC
VNYAGLVLTELVTRPVQAVVALIELPVTARKSLEEVNELLEVSRRQLEAMERQTGNALDQAERMNELLTRVVRLTEPLEKAQRGGEYVADGLKRVIFGDPVAGVEGTAQRVERAAAEAELAASDAESAALDAEEAAEAAEEATEEAERE